MTEIIVLKAEDLKQFEDIDAWLQGSYVPSRDGDHKYSNKKGQGLAWPGDVKGYSSLIQPGSRVGLNVVLIL